MDNRAIGIFDSGIGGLTSLKTLRALLPEEIFIFFAEIFGYYRNIFRIDFFLTTFFCPKIFVRMNRPKKSKDDFWGCQ